MPANARRALGGALLAAPALILALAGASWRYSLPRPEIGAPAIRVFAEARPIAVIRPPGGAEGWLSLDRIPRPVVDAVLIAEDRRFWGHPGVDLLAIGRAIGTNLKHDEVREGASTITQQLARTLFLDTSRTWRRKLHEAFIALLLEARWEDLCDAVVFVDAPDDVRRRRVRNSRGWGRETWQARENLQLALKDKKARADDLVDNSGTPDETFRQVQRILSSLVAPLPC